jgi:hypothetical protein
VFALGFYGVMLNCVFDWVFGQVCKFVVRLS